MPKLALSVNDFCNEHAISRSGFYSLLKRGLGPRTMQVGGRTLISTEAAADWRRKCETQNQAA